MKRALARIVAYSPLVFICITTIIGVATPGYDHFSQTVSRLSIESLGWIQSLNLLLFSIQLLIASELLAINANNPKTRRYLKWTFLLTAVTGALLAIFPTDPIDSFPKKIFTLSFNAALHFSIVILYVCTTPILIARLVKTFRSDPQFTQYTRSTAFIGYGAFILSLIWFVFFAFGILDGWRGLYQKILLIATLSWLTAVMRKLSRSEHHNPSSS